MDISGIDYLGLDRVMRRGSGEIIAERDDALLIRDRVSGAYLLACDDAAAGLSLLDRYIGPDCRLLMVPDADIAGSVYDRCGLTHKLECYQVAYYGDPPACDSGLTFRTADAGDLPLLTGHYHMIAPEELKAVVERRSLLLGYEGDHLVGFVGEHLEGSMGLLYVFPAYRHRDCGAALQKRLIALTAARGYIPFGQVEKENLASLRLQEKLGMTRSDRIIVWMWK